MAAPFWRSRRPLGDKPPGVPVALMTVCGRLMSAKVGEAQDSRNPNQDTNGHHLPMWSAKDMQ